MQRGAGAWGVKGVGALAARCCCCRCCRHCYVPSVLARWELTARHTHRLHQTANLPLQVRLDPAQADEAPSSMQAFVCGLAAGMLAKLGTHPLDVAKKRFQVGLVGWWLRCTWARVGQAGLAPTNNGQAVFCAGTHQAHSLSCSWLAGGGPGAIGAVWPGRARRWLPRGRLQFDERGWAAGTLLAAHAPTCCCSARPATAHTPLPFPNALPLHWPLPPCSASHPRRCTRCGRCCTT